MILTLPQMSKEKDIPITLQVSGTSSYEWSGNLHEEQEFEIDMKESMMIVKRRDTT